MKNMSHEWLKAARDDLLLMEDILNRDYLTHMVAFHAQQCIEKCLKAVLEEYKIEIPKIHKLVTLSGIVENKIPFHADYEMLKKQIAFWFNH